MQLKCVTSVWSRIDAEVGRLREQKLHAGLDGRDVCKSRGRAVASTEDEIVVTVDDLDWTGKVGGYDSGAEGDDLAVSDRLLCGLIHLEYSLVVIWVLEECHLVVVDVRPGEIGVVQVGVCGVSESGGDVDVGELWVESSESLRNPGGVGGVSSQDDSGGDVWVHGDKTVGDDGSEGVTDVDRLGIGGVDTRERTVSSHHGDGPDNVDLGRSLDLEKTIWLARRTTTQSVDGKSVITGCSYRRGVRGGIGEIPIGLVKSDPMDQDLQWIGAVGPGGSGRAVGGRDVVLLNVHESTVDKGGRLWLWDLNILSNERGHLRLVLWVRRSRADDHVLSVDRDRDRDIAALLGCDSGRSGNDECVCE